MIVWRRQRPPYPTRSAWLGTRVRRCAAPRVGRTEQEHGVNPFLSCRISSIGNIRGNAARLVHARSRLERGPWRAGVAGDPMRTCAAFLASLPLYVIATAAFAQGFGDIINRVEGLVHSAIAKAAAAEWKKVPQTEFSCVNQKLQERGDSLQSLVQRGVFPSDRRVSHIRSQCRSSDQTSAESKYVVDG